MEAQKTIQVKLLKIKLQAKARQCRTELNKFTIILNEIIKVMYQKINNEWYQKFSTDDIPSLNFKFNFFIEELRKFNENLNSDQLLKQAFNLPSIKKIYMERLASFQTLYDLYNQKNPKLKENQKTEEINLKKSVNDLCKQSLLFMIENVQMFPSLYGDLKGYIIETYKSDPSIVYTLKMLIGEHVQAISNPQEDQGWFSFFSLTRASSFFNYNSGEKAEEVSPEIKAIVKRLFADCDDILSQPYEKVKIEHERQLNDELERLCRDLDASEPSDATDEIDAAQMTNSEGASDNQHIGGDDPSPLHPPTRM